MSSESSAAKWLVGCLIAGVAGVLLCGGAIALIGFWGYGVARQVAQEIGPEFQKQMQGMQFAAEWRPPPPDAGPDELFPEEFAAWMRRSYDDQAAIPELGIARDGFHGVYKANGMTVNVYAYPVAINEQGPLFAEAVKAIDTAGYTTRSQANVDLGSFHWMTFEFSPPQRFGRMWWASGWLVVTMTDNPAVNLENFEQGYLLAIQESPDSGIDQLQPVPADPTTVEPDGAPSPSTTVPAEQDDEAAPAEPAADGHADAEPGDAAGSRPPDQSDDAPENPEATAPGESPRG